MICIGPHGWCEHISQTIGEHAPDNQTVVILLNFGRDFKQQLRCLHEQVSLRKNVIVSSMTTRNELCTDSSIRTLLEKCTFIDGRNQSVIEYFLHNDPA